MCKMLAVRLFGRRYGAAVRAALMCAVIWAALQAAQMRFSVPVRAAAAAFAVFTGWLMWQDMTSAVDDVRGIFALPFPGRAFVTKWTGMLALYVLVCRTLPILVLAGALGGWSALQTGAVTAGSFAAALVTAAGYAWKRTPGCAAFCAAFAAGAWTLAESSLFWVLAAGSAAAAAFRLACADPYRFMPKKRAARFRRGTDARAGAGTLRYLLRAMNADSAAWFNTFFMWVFGAVLAFMLAWEGGPLIFCICFAVLCVNTPASTVLSKDAATWRAVRFLPRQKLQFALPYCFFLFVLNDAGICICLTASALAGRTGGADLVLTGTGLALEAALISVFLEWYFPVRAWKTKSDLWRHPRKYIVPAMIFVLGTLLAQLPAGCAWLWGALGVQILLCAVWKQPARKFRSRA